MADKNFPNSGLLFVNDKRREGKNDPDRDGTADVTCPHCQRRFQMWISGWVKTAKTGSKFMSLSFKLKYSARRATGLSIVAI